MRVTVERIDNIIKDQSANTTIGTVGLVLGTIFMIFIMMDFLGVFVVKRQSQTVADAAALAAVHTLEVEFKKALNDKAYNTVLPQFCVDVSNAVNEEYGPSDIINAWISHPQLASKLIAYYYNPDAKPPLGLLTKESYFQSLSRTDFDEYENGQLLFNEASAHLNDIGTKADELALKNNGKSGVEMIIFPENTVKLQVLVRKAVPLIFMGKYFSVSAPDLTAQASAGFESEQLEINMSGLGVITR